MQVDGKIPWQRAGLSGLPWTPPPQGGEPLNQSLPPTAMINTAVTPPSDLIPLGAAGLFTSGCFFFFSRLQVVRDSSRMQGRLLPVPRRGGPGEAEEQPRAPGTRPAVSFLSVLRLGSKCRWSHDCFCHEGKPFVAIGSADTSQQAAYYIIIGFSLAMALIYADQKKEHLGVPCHAVGEPKGRLDFQGNTKSFFLTHLKPPLRRVKGKTAGKLNVYASK